MHKQRQPGGRRRAPQQQRIPLQSGKNPRVLTAPAAMAKKMMTSFSVSAGKEPDSVHIRGRDYLSSVLAPSAGPLAKGAALVNIDMNPLELAGTRLSKFAEIYDKFEFKRASLHFVPCLPPEAGGSVGLTYDVDVDDATPGPGDAGVRQYFGHKGTDTGPYWAPLSIDLAFGKVKGDLFTNPSTDSTARFAYQGQVYVWNMSSPITSIAAGDPLGDIFLEYEIDLFSPSMDPPIQAALVESNATTLSFGDGNDALYPFAVNNATYPPQTGESTNPSLQPVIGSDGTARLTLPPGTYDVKVAVTQSQAGAVGYDPAGFKMNSQGVNPPISYPGQQTLAQEILYRKNSANTFDTATMEAILAIPKGGATATLDYSTATGLTTGTQAYFSINKISEGWLDPAAFQY